MEHWDRLRGDQGFYWDDGLFRPSTDTFLLGGFPVLRRGERACDLGAGTGLLGALLLTREPSLTVTGLELREAACRLARRPAARSGWEVFWLYNGLHATMYYRVAHWLYEHRLRFLGRWVSQFARRRTGIEIHPAAKIGRRLVIDHGTGIVIGATTEIGDDCLLYQNVTLGGTGMTNGKRHPTLGNNVMVGSGAKVLGPFKVGDNARIAANSVVLHEVPPDSTVVGVPGRVVRRNGEKLDHIHTPDPVRLELDALYARIEKLEEKLKEDQDVSL